MSFSPYEELSDFPCSFNLQVNNSISRKRFQSTQKKLIEELDWDKLTLEQKVRILNLLTWVTFSLGNETEQAVKYNNESLRLTKSSNLTALCNRIFISFEIGDQTKYKEELKFVKSLKERANFDVLKTEALAEQAFAYVKLGFVNLHSMSRKLLSSCTAKCPDNYLWKLDLGMVCGRLTQSHFNLTAGDDLSVDELMSTCVQQLMVVGKKAPDRLRGLAYAELACLRQHNSQPKWDPMFNDLKITDLCERALLYGSDDPVVLAQCGNCLKGINIDLAIRKIEQSIQLRPTSKAYHQLGLCFVKKADMASPGRRHNPRQSADVHSHRQSANVHFPRQSANVHFPRQSANVHFPRQSSNVYSPRQSANVHSRRQSANDYSRQNRNKQSLKMYAFANLTPLEKENGSVLKATKCYEKAIEISFGVNLTARQCLGELYYKLGKYQDALREFNQIINTPNSNATHIVTLISAHSLAGKSLLMINKTVRSPQNLDKAKEHFVKTVSLAAGLARQYREYKDCTIEVWDAFKKLLKDTEQAHFPQLTDMVEYTVFQEIETMLSKGLNMADINTLLDVLNRDLNDGHYETALTYLNMAMTNDYLKQEASVSSELLALQTRIYMSTSWRRLLKGSNDVQTLFQQMFEQRYGQCAGKVEADEDLQDGQLRRQDVLILYHESSDSKTLAHNLFKVMGQLFGLQTSLNLERQATDTTDKNSADQLLKVMVRHSVTLMILDDSDPGSYNEAITAVHSVNGSNVFVIDCRQRKPLPGILERNRTLNMMGATWPKMKLLDTALKVEIQENEVSDMSSTDVVKELFNGDVESVMRLFCFIVDEKFEYHQKCFKPNL